MKESYHVLRKDPELMVLTFAAFLGVAIVILIAGALGVGTDFVGADGVREIALSDIVSLGVAYFISYFILIYCQVALVSAVQLRLSRGDPNVWYGLAQANRRLGAILSWAVIAATVGLILRMLEGVARKQRGAGALVGMIVVGLLGASWNLLVFFVIPVIAAEKVGGFQALRRSTRFAKQHWGEAIVGPMGMGLGIFLLILIAAGPFLLLGILQFPEDGEANLLLGGIFLGIGAFVTLLLMVFSAALNSTYRAVLFAYANNGTTGRFAKETLDHAFATA